MRNDTFKGLISGFLELELGRHRPLQKPPDEKVQSVFERTCESKLHLAMRKGDSSALPVIHPSSLYDGTVTHHYNKRRRDSLGRIPADVTPASI
ncbi:hypothetical protein INR49_016296 [Caranx melampygus]|nr:hypothetical protein INR49_016296 [Caranx melampygus]